MGYEQRAGRPPAPAPDPKPGIRQSIDLGRPLNLSRGAGEPPPAAGSGAPLPHYRWSAMRLSRTTKLRFEVYVQRDLWRTAPPELSGPLTLIISSSDWLEGTISFPDGHVSKSPHLSSAASAGVGTTLRSRAYHQGGKQTVIGPAPEATMSLPENAARLRADIDSGRTGDKVPAADPAAAPLGTDEEAAGTPTAPEAIARARQQETLRQHAPRPRRGLGHAWVQIAIVALIAGALIAWGLLGTP
jgi:hypothetical protein